MEVVPCKHNRLQAISPQRGVIESRKQDYCVANGQAPVRRVHIAVAPTPMPSHAPEEASALGESQTTGTLLGTRIQSERGESESAHRVGVVAVAVALSVCGGFLGGILGRLNFWTFIKPLWSLQVNSRTHVS